MTEKELLDRYNKLHSNTSEPDDDFGFVDFLYKNTNELPKDIDANLALKKIKNKIDNNSNPSNKIWLKIAASVAILLSCILGINYLQEDKTNNLIVSSNNVNKLIELPDGSKTILNKNSTLSFPKSFGKNRIVKLKGEAYFDIKKDKKTFAVNAGEVEVKVLGTAFNVNTEGDIVTLYVDRGLVAFKSKNNEIRLKKGESAFFNKKTKKIIKTSYSSNIMSWRNGQFKFNETSLNDVCKTLEKYYNLNFEIKNEELKQQKITASFNKQNIDTVMESIITALQCKYYYHKASNKIVITK